MRIGPFELGFSRAADDGIDQAPVQVRGIIEATAEDMEAINRVASQQLSADQVYILEPVVSTNALDSYFTRMAESSLANYVQDAIEGNPLMTGHDRRSLPIGRSISGAIEDIDGLSCVVLRDYMLRGHEISGQKTDEIARGIQAGTLGDMSISFGGSDHWYRCGVCNRDLWDPACEHVPGVQYADMRAFAWVEDARMTEHSIVYSGSTPGALVRKARSMAEAGKLSRADIGFLEETWRCRLLDPARSYSLPPEREQRKDDTMKARELLAKLRSALTPDMAALFGLRFDQIGAGLSEDTPIDAILGQLMDAIRAAGDTAVANALAPFRELGISSVDELKAALERAKLGDKYRSDLITEALAEGTRAFSDKFDRERYERAFASATIDDIKAFRSEWADVAKSRLGEAGRQTSSADPNAKPRGAQMTTEEEATRAKEFGKR